MDVALTTKWISNILDGTLPEDFYIEIRGLTPGGKRTQFTYVSIQEFFLAASGLEPAEFEVLVNTLINASIATKQAAGEFGNDLASANW